MSLVEKKPVLTVEKGLMMLFLLIILGLFSCRTLGINQNAGFREFYYIYLKN